MSQFAKVLVAVTCLLGLASRGRAALSVKHEELTLTISDTLKLELIQGGATKLSAQLAQGRSYTNAAACDAYHLNCLKFGEVTLNVHANVGNGFTLEWTTQNTSLEFRDCYALNNGTTSWFGGPERYNQHWPIEKLVLENFANVGQERGASAVVEPYWLNSKGAYIFVDEEVPLFIDQNVDSSNAVCFVSKLGSPYPARSKILLRYTIYATDTPREAHMNAVQHFLGKPTGHPNAKMIQRPVWSTWARYKRDVSDSLVLEFANEIIDYGFSDGQFEIDDNWETCYGSLTFRSPEFENVTATVKTLKSQGFRVTLWVHPFVNVNCTEYTNIGKTNGYFVLNEEGSELTQWWNTGTHEAQLIDFTKTKARDWFYDRLKALKEKHDIDSYKFDAGETSWAPQVSVLQGDVDVLPNKMTSDYVRICAKFGDLVEVRSAWKSQDLPIFVRMIDKDSHWGTDNGLYTLITTLLQMNMNGYSLVLPDMVGGNGYDVFPSAQLFVRWLQANTFMPSIQFSYVPWDYLNATFDVVEISKKFVALHDAYSEEILRVMNRSVSDGTPTNAPVWWIEDGASHEVFQIDTQFLLGEDIVVAPVVTENATSRDIYLPSGVWVDGNTGTVHEGQKTLQGYSAAIDVLPYFVRQGSNAEVIYKAQSVKSSAATSRAVLWNLLVYFVLFHVLSHYL